MGLRIYDPIPNGFHSFCRLFFEHFQCTKIVLVTDDTLINSMFTRIRKVEEATSRFVLRRTLKKFSTKTSYPV